MLPPIHSMRSHPAPSQPRCPHPRVRVRQQLCVDCNCPSAGTRPRQGCCHRPMPAIRACGSAKRIKPSLTIRRQGSMGMPFRPCLSAVRNHRIAVRLPSEFVSALRRIPQLGPALLAGRNAAATDCLATLRKAALNKGRSRGERAYCSALRRARGGIFE
jgi:hypothetical protein